MRVNIIFKAILLLMLVGFLSCEEGNEDQWLNAEDYYGDGSYFISLARLSSPEINEDYCDIPTVFEFRSLNNFQGLATVSIYSDGHFLNFQHYLTQNAISEGWIISTSYVWVGLAEDWNFGKKGPEGWASIPGVNRKTISPNSISALQQIPLEKWMFEECFAVGVRLILDIPGSMHVSPRSFINNGDYLTYSWNEPFCLEKCIDPGSQTSEFWKFNPEEWPHGLLIGNIFYSIELAIQTMNAGAFSEDITYSLFEQIIAAKLNVALGNTSYCIVETIEAADAWMVENGPVGSGVLSGHPAWTTGNSLANQLESYNNGLMCADPAK